MARRSGLGKGLGALIPPTPGVSTGSMLRDVPLARIRPNPFQPRSQFGEQGLSALVDSIKAVGILQPVLVREVGPDEYELIAGERRFRAARRAGLQSIPALVHQADDAMSLEEALVENLHREDLNPLDEAGAYQQLIEEFNLTHEEVARKVGRSRAGVTNALRLFQLPPTVQRYVRDGQLSAGHARTLLGTPDRLLQERLASEAVHNGLSVRSLEEVVRKELQREQAEESGLEGVPDDTGNLTSGPAGEDTASPEIPGPRLVRSLRPPGVHDLEELLEDRLNTRVKVDMGGKRGKLVIEFATLDDLERIYRIIVGETFT
ncbi:MAG: ParB/RepB/Spo0J family partition protein [Acidimicrobiales bacterium]